MTYLIKPVTVFNGVTNIDIIAPIYYALSETIEIQNPRILPNKKPPNNKLNKNIQNTSIESLFKSPNQ